jgi:hypothetical protein
MRLDRRSRTIMLLLYFPLHPQFARSKFPSSVWTSFDKGFLIPAIHDPQVVGKTRPEISWKNIIY